MEILNAENARKKKKINSAANSKQISPNHPKKEKRKNSINRFVESCVFFFCLGSFPRIIRGHGTCCHHSSLELWYVVRQLCFYSYAQPMSIAPHLP